MSLNLKVELPMQTVRVIQSAAKLGDKPKTLRLIRTASDQAVLDAIEQLPCDLIPRAEASGQTSPADLKRSLPSPEPNPTPPQRIKSCAGSLMFNVRTTTGREHHLYLLSSATIGFVKEKMEELTGYPPVMQRLIYGGKQMSDDKTLEEVSIPDVGMQKLTLA